jgi:hypothetical protein
MWKGKKVQGSKLKAQGSRLKAESKEFTAEIAESAEKRIGLKGN